MIVLIKSEKLDAYKRAILNGLSVIDVKILSIDFKQQEETLEMALCFKCPCGNTLTEVVNAPLSVFENKINAIVNWFKADLIKHLKEDGFL